MRFFIPYSFLLATIAPAAPVSFSKQIAPLLVDQCLECHRAEKAKGAYQLDNFELLLKAGDSEAPPVTPGKPEASELLRLLTVDDDADRMPKKADPLPKEAVALIRQWIVEGAVFDGPSPKTALTNLLPDQRVQAPQRYPRPLPVTALAVNGDGKVLLTSGYHEVLAWDPDSGKLRTRLSGLPERVLGLSFVQGGPWLAAVGGTPGRSGEVWLINYAKPTERKRLVQLRDCALCAVVTPDGRTLITGGADNRVRAFALPEGKPLWNFEVHADWVLALAISPDGQYVASASRDRTARVIKVQDGTVEGTFTGHSTPVLSVAFSPDGQEVLSGSSDGETRRWTLNGAAKKDGLLRPAGRSEMLALGHLDAATLIAAAGSGQVSSVDLAKRQVKATFLAPGERVNALWVIGSGDTQRIITGGHDGRIRVIQAKDRQVTSEFLASPGWQPQN